MILDAILPPSTGGKPPFADAREAKEWLKLLPLINVNQSALELTEALEQLNAGRIDAVELLKTLELLRDAIHTTQDGLLAQYSGKALPLQADEIRHWERSLQLWSLLETAYARCWRAVRDGHGGLAEHHALIAERTMRCACLLARSHLLIYRPVPQTIWQRLFDYYRMAEDAGVARTTVRDSLIEIHGTSMPQAMLIHALLLVCASSRQLTAKQLIWLDHRLEVLAARTALAPHSQALPGKSCLQIDLDAPAPALRASRPLTGPGVREVDTLVLAQVLTKRIKLLREGELPQKLGLGTELGPQSAEALLVDLYRRWCELPTELPFRRKDEIRSGPAGLELANIQRLIDGGKMAPPPEDSVGVDRRGLEELQLFGRSGTTINPKEKPVGVAEQWEILREAAQDLLLARPAGSPRRIGLQQLIGIATAGYYQIGVVRSLEDTDGILQIGVRLLAGTPLPAMARPIDLVRMGQSKYGEILLLPAFAALKTPDSMILPTGWYRQGRLLDVWNGEGRYRVRLVQVLERGTDFERVLFSMTSS